MEIKLILNNNFVTSKNNKKGITLIALIITIILLLILSGLCLSILTQSGIIGRAVESKKVQIIGELKESLTLALSELQIDKSGKATISDVTNEWVQNRLNAYNPVLENDTDSDGKLITLNKDGIAVTFRINKDLSIENINDGPSEVETPPHDTNAVNIYVSNSGNDSNSGTNKGQPLKTITAAQEMAKNHIKDNSVNINILGGSYYINSPIEISQEYTDGKNGHTLSFIGDGNTTITGGITLPNDWTQVDSNIWKINLDKNDYEEINTFYVNGNKQKIAQSDAFEGEYLGFVKYGSDVGNRKKGYQSSQLYIDIPSSDLPKNKIDTNVEELYVTYKWECLCSVFRIKQVDTIGSTTRLTVSDNTLSAINFFEYSDGRNYHEKYHYTGDRDRFIIKNSYNLMDENGEYFYDKNTGTLYLYTNQNPNTSTCVIPKTENFVTIKGTQNEFASGISFENISFEYGNCLENNDIFINRQCDLGIVPIENSSYIWQDGERAARKPVFVLENASNITFKNNNFKHINANAIRLNHYVFNVKISNNNFNDIGGSAITIGDITQYYDLFLNDSENGGSLTLPNDLTNVYSNAGNYTRIPVKIEISNNRLENISNEYSSTSAITVYTANTVDIANNHFENMPYCRSFC